METIYCKRFFNSMINCLYDFWKFLTILSLKQSQLLISSLFCSILIGLNLKYPSGVIKIVSDLIEKALNFNSKISFIFTIKVIISFYHRC